MCFFDDDNYYDDGDELCLNEPFRKRFTNSLKVYKVSEPRTRSDADYTFILAESREKAVEFSGLRDLKKVYAEIFEDMPTFIQRTNDWNEPIDEIEWEPEDDDYDTEYCVIQPDLFKGDPSTLLYSEKYQ